MLNLHLQAVEKELVKIIPLVADLQVALGRRPASECSKQNGFFAQEEHSSVSREHAILKIDADQRVRRCSVARAKQVQTQNISSCLSQMRDQSWEPSSTENVFHPRARFRRLFNSTPEICWYATPRQS